MGRRERRKWGGGREGSGKENEVEGEEGEESREEGEGSRKDGKEKVGRKEEEAI